MVPEPRVVFSPVSFVSLIRFSVFQRLRGRIGATVQDTGLPGNLVLHFEEAAGDARKGLEACLRFLASGWQPPPAGQAQ